MRRNLQLRHISNKRIAKAIARLCIGPVESLARHAFHDALQRESMLRSTGQTEYKQAWTNREYNAARKDIITFRKANREKLSRKEA